jgi:hypothetical protein
VRGRRVLDAVRVEGELGVDVVVGGAGKAGGDAREG